MSRQVALFLETEKIITQDSEFDMTKIRNAVTFRVQVTNRAVKDYRYVSPKVPSIEWNVSLSKYQSLLNSTGVCIPYKMKCSTSENVF